MPDIEAIQASAPEVMKWDLTIRVGTMRNHDYCSSKAAEKTAQVSFGSWHLEGAMGQMYRLLNTDRTSHANLRPICAILTNGGAMRTHG